MATPFEVRCERRTETGTNGNEETADPKPCPMSETRTRTFPLLLVGLLGGMRPAVRMKRNNISFFLYTLYTAELVAGQRRAVAESGYWVI